MGPVLRSHQPKEHYSHITRRNIKVQKCKNLADGFLMYIRKTEGNKGEDVFTNEACFQLYLDIGYLARKPASGRHEPQNYPVGPGNRYSMTTNQDDFSMKENEIKDGLNVEYWTTHPLRSSFQLGEGMDRDSRKDLRDAINGFQAMLNGDAEKMDIECVKKAWRTCERHLNEVLKPFEYLPQQTNEFNCCNIS